jgi:predicted nucleic acid-binding protein
MIFCDTSYLVRLYLEDPGWEIVRDLCASDQVAACQLALAEIPAALHRATREGRMDDPTYKEVMAQFLSDCAEDAFSWQALTADIYLQLHEDFALLPFNCFLRAADALHLACARANGFSKVYSNDRHFLASAPYFGLEGINLLRDQGRVR